MEVAPHANRSSDHVARPSRPADTAQLPSLYQPWIEAMLGGALPAETEATCHACVMLPEAGVAQPDDPSPASERPLFFDPRMKCCTYVPALPNFLVGRILLDTTPEMAAGRESVRARIAAGIGVMPLGLAQPPTFVVLYARGGAETFGRSVELRCPHYVSDTGGCGIWRHRQSICTTWFCKYTRGAVGERVWRDLRHLLGIAERVLAVHCVRALSLEPEAARDAAALFPATTPAAFRAQELEGAPDPPVRALWGHHAGRESAFYEAAGRLVGDLGWEDVRRAGGPELDLAVDVLRTSYAALVARRVPRALRIGAIHRRPLGDGAAEVVAYSGYHPITLPASLMSVLHVFDGRPTAAALAAAVEAGVAIDRAVVRQLVDMGVLVDADAAS